MLKINPINTRMWSKLGSRGTMGLAMLELGNREDLIVLTADLAKTSGLERFKSAHPDKFFNMGIAEQNMIGYAGGMAKEGHTVYVTTFANFAAMRSYEQMRLNLGYMELNVKVIGLGSGLVMSMFGNTHYGIEDMALMRAIPNLTVLSPADGAEIVKTVIAAAEHDGPVYIRLTGGMNNPIVYKEEYDFEIGKAITLKEGSDITIIATGTMVHASLEAAVLLEQSGISSTVIDMHTIKPLDTYVIDKACQTSKLIVTVEEHSIVGGLGGAVAEYKATLDRTPRQLFIGLPDKFGKPGDYNYMLKKYGLTSDQIANQIEQAMKNPL
ncbi:transketolase family protein [Paenibacillus peoriae]|uniref:transketolase family protein n=1 Tax=Paenibacillus peoriae TaxID=59893 RepID=UPI00096D17B8|nr:transketolase C-terminal domain-containing protein [Paenibacillus peoriae]OMF49983.1 transketolase [Paenibacillus peoriae]